MGTDRKAVAKARKKTQMLLDEREHEFLRRGRERDAQKPEAAAAAPAAKGKKVRKGTKAGTGKGEYIDMYTGNPPAPRGQLLGI